MTDHGNEGGKNRTGRRGLIAAVAFAALGAVLAVAAALESALLPEATAGFFGFEQPDDSSMPPATVPSDRSRMIFFMGFDLFWQSVTAFISECSEPRFWIQKHFPMFSCQWSETPDR